MSLLSLSLLFFLCVYFSFLSFLRSLACSFFMFLSFFLFRFFSLLFVQFEEKLEGDKAELEKETERLAELLDSVENEMTDFSQATEYHKKIVQLDQQLQTAKAKADEFKKAEVLFAVEEASDYSRLDDLITRFEPYKKVNAFI